MSTINLLFVEDDPLQIQGYNDTIDLHNKRSEFKIQHEICQNYQKGKEALETPYYDAAIIDLKLSGSDELEGRKLVEAVHEKIRIPIVIYSGSISQIDDIKETALLKKRVRTDQLKDILIEIIAIYKTGITQLLRPKGEIDTKLTEIFWNHLADDLDTWVNHNNPKALLRHIFNHFQEHMEIDIDGNFEEYHQTEVYLTPPIKTNIHTGDLIRTDGEYYFVLTPACDIVLNEKKDSVGDVIRKRKADNLTIAKVIEFDFKNMCVVNGKLNKKKIEEFVMNKSLRYHYLPSYKGNNGFLIDFQTLASKSFNDPLEIEATISGAFSKDVIQRFSNYFARQGQPTFSQKDIVQKLFNSVT